MTTDLEQRLREPDWHDPACPFKTHCYCGTDDELPPHDRVRHPLAIEAADELARLRAENERLREALGPFAEAAEDLEESTHDSCSMWEHHVSINVEAGDFRRARAAIRSGDAG